MSIIIDGYNLLRWAQGDEDYEAMDENTLCAVVSQYLLRTRKYGQVVFDGLGPPDKTLLGGLPNLEVYFSGMETDADTIIAEKIIAYTAPKNLVIVSTDREVRAAAQSRKAVSVRSDIFWEILVEQLERKLPIREPKEKQSGISDMETEQWLDFFDIDD